MNTNRFFRTLVTMIFSVVILGSAAFAQGGRGQQLGEKVAQKLNRLLGGWSRYFSHGTVSSAYQAVNRHVEDRARRFLRRRHKTPSRGTRQFSRERLYGELGVLRLQRGRGSTPTCALL